ncbi:MAG: FAD-dependent oxidoreductase [Nostocoides sp.]
MERTTTDTTDVLIVGLGIAGVCAAIEARDAGAQVLALDWAGAGGGASALSSGILYLGGGTAVQEACGYADDTDNMTAYMLASTPGTDPAVVQAFCEGSVEHFNWLEEQGVPFERTSVSGKNVILFTTECLFYTGNEKAWPWLDLARPAPRGHKVAGKGEHAGYAAMASLLQRCTDVGVRTRLNTKAVALLVEGDRVVGVRASGPDGELEIRARRGVILATGMFTYGTDLVAEHIPLISDSCRPLGIETNDGNGLELAVTAGAALEAMDGMIATASIYPPESLVRGIIVNSSGRRIVAEDAYHGRQAHFIAEQPDQTAFLLVDEANFGYPANRAAGHKLLGVFESIPEAASAMGVDPTDLEQTLRQYNTDAAAGHDDLFHKQPEWLCPLNPPLAVFDISFNKSMYLFTTLGGITSDADGRALREDGSAVPGLYAVGACAAHLTKSGKTYASGMSLGPGSFFGRRAGRHAATTN